MVGQSSRFLWDVVVRHLSVYHEMRARSGAGRSNRRLDGGAPRRFAGAPDRTLHRKAGDTQGTGQAIGVLAVDILRVRDGKAIDHWHLEVKLRFMQQAGLLAK